MITRIDKINNLIKYEPKELKLIDKAFKRKLPILGVCRGMQLLNVYFGGSLIQDISSQKPSDVKHRDAVEYDKVHHEIKITDGTPLSHIYPSTGVVNYVHHQAIERLGDDLIPMADSPDQLVEAFCHSKQWVWGVQWHPEVMHSEHGQRILEHFLWNIAKCAPTWTIGNIAEEQVERVRAQIGETGRAICGLSGGVDSAVAGAIVAKAIGERLTCVYVDHGLMRKGESEQVERDFVAATGAKLVVVDAEKQFLDALAGVSDPETKRKIIGREFIRTFEGAQSDIIDAAPEGTTVGFLVQGTLYPDVVESGHGAGAATIKSHHNVGGLPEDIEFELVEPLRTLFKDEVRAVGAQLGLPDVIVQRQPFPGPGLGIRIIGEVTRERLDILREADAIAREEMTRAGLDHDIWQMPVVLLADGRSFPATLRYVARTASETTRTFLVEAALDTGDAEGLAGVDVEGDALQQRPVLAGQPEAPEMGPLEDADSRRCLFAAVGVLLAPVVAIYDGDFLATNDWSRWGRACLILENDMAVHCSMLASRIVVSRIQ